MQQRRPKLAVCWIWGSPLGYMDPMESLLELRHPDGVDVRFFRGKGWGPARRHIVACEKALAWGADHILILGADQIYEPDLLERLISRRYEDSRYEVIAALVPTRGYIASSMQRPFQPVAWRLKGQGLVPISGSAVEHSVPIDPADGDMQRIDFIGSGCLMFDASHLEMLKRPWFAEQIDHKTQIRTACMDSTFVYRLKTEAYAQVWADTTIEIQHLHPFKIDKSFQQRFADWATPGAGEASICRYEEKPRPAQREEVAV